MWGVNKTSWVGVRRVKSVPPAVAGGSQGDKNPPLPQAVLTTPTTWLKRLGENSNVEPSED